MVLFIFPVPSYSPILLGSIGELRIEFSNHMIVSQGPRWTQASEDLDVSGAVDPSAQGREQPLVAVDGCGILMNPDLAPEVDECYIYIYL